MTAKYNRLAIAHWMNVKDMETAVHGATQIAADVRHALITELAADMPRTLQEVLAPFKAKVDAMKCHWS